MKNSWGIIVFFLFVFMILELAILFLDKGRMRRYAGAFVRNLGDVGLARTLVLSARKLRRILLKLLGKSPEKDAEESTAESETEGKQDDGSLHLAFEFEGGIGDYLMNANWYWYFHREYVGDNIFVDIFACSKSILSIFMEDISNTNVYTGRRADRKLYDAVFSVVRIPRLVFCDESRFPSISSELYDYIRMCQHYQDENKPVCNNMPLLDGFQGLQCIARGIKRIQQADIYGRLGITEEYKFPIKIQENEDAYLESLGLKDIPFIIGVIVNSCGREFYAI